MVKRIFEDLIGQKVKSGALIGQQRVKRERESKGLVIPIFEILYSTEVAYAAWVIVLKYTNVLNR